MCLKDWLPMPVRGPERVDALLCKWFCDWALAMRKLFSQDTAR
jgi:hypothetical protein